jgi:hypothetical protein
VIEDAAKKATKAPEMIQLVGHTMAYCYDPGNPGVHPPDSQVGDYMIIGLI